MQTRIVTCLDQWDKPSEECDPKTRMTSTQECSTGIQCAAVDETKSTTTAPGIQITKKFQTEEDPEEDLDEDVGSEEDFEESLHHIRHHSSMTTTDNAKQTTPEEMLPTPEEPSELRMQRDDSRAYSNYRHHENYGHQIYYPHQALPKPEKLVDQRVPSEAT